jgi:hypothetical protein
MQIIEIPYRVETISPPRSKGVHVSEIIRRILNDLHPGKYLEFSPDADPTRLCIGLAWEDFLGKHFDSQGRNLIHNPELTIPPGIHGTPDFIDMDDGLIIESKCTWKSSNRDIEEDYRPWFWQIQSYLYGTGFRKAQLYVAFVMGDYRNSGPQVKRWDMEFSQREIDDNWSMLMAAAKTFGLL